MSTKKPAKFKFGATPKSFKKDVEIIMLDGSSSVIEFSFIYRTRPEFAALVDERIAASKKKQDVDEDVSDRTVKEWFALADAASADNVLDVVDGWDLDEDLNKESLLRLEAEYPGSLDAIAGTYRQAVAEVRTKN